jgi:nucleotide-binding universal stress UspA family protein
MLNHVLVPLDGSLLAQTALDHALILLGENSRITLVTVLEPQEIALSEFYPSTIIPKPSENDQFMNAAIARAKNYLNQLSEDTEVQYGYRVTTAVEIGDPATALTDIAKEAEVDAIVMSTHGRSGISRWLFGSVTQKVLSAAPCPVFVIPAKVRDEAKSRGYARSHTS